MGSDSGICSTTVTCPGNLCRASLCVPNYAWSRPLPDCGPGLALVPAGGVVVASKSNTINVDADGNVRWQHSYSSFDAQFASYSAVVVLSDGSTVIAAAGNQETFDSGATLGTQGTDTFLVKWSPSGDYDWIKTFPNPYRTGRVEVAALARGPGDTITLAGTYAGEVILDLDGVAPYVGTTSLVPAIIFVAQDSADGKFGWAQSFASSGNGSVSGLAVGPDGAIVAGGEFIGSGAFGGDPSMPNRGSLFVARLTATGTLGGAGTWVDTNIGPNAASPPWTMAPDGSVFAPTTGALARISTTGTTLWSVAGTSWSSYGLTAPGPSSCSVTTAEASICSWGERCPTSWSRPRARRSSPPTTWTARCSGCASRRCSCRR